MCYPDFPFPNYRESYLSAEKVLKYLHDYADHFYIRKYIKVSFINVLYFLYSSSKKNVSQFNQWVKEVKPIVMADKETTWELSVFDWETKDSTTLTFDAVVVCNGYIIKTCLLFYILPCNTVLKSRLFL